LRKFFAGDRNFPSKAEPPHARGVSACGRPSSPGAKKTFFADNIANLITALQTAIYKRGIPEQLYVDNGSNYASVEVSNICTRIGTLLCHTPVRDGAAKGKIERFFRTVRARFLARELDLSSLEALNRQFTLWVEEDYNCRVHSTLGMTKRGSAEMA